MFWIAIGFILLGYVYLINKLGPNPQTKKYKVFAFLGAFPVVIFAVIIGVIVHVSILESPSINRWGAERLLSNGVETNYYQDDDEIFYRSLSVAGFVKPKDFVLHGVDLNSFEIIYSEAFPQVRSWAKDNNSVYNAHYKTDFDPQTFRIISTNVNNQVEHVSDRSGVYYHNYATSTIFITSEVDKFKDISNLDRYWTDGKKVFSVGIEITGADPETFEIINNYWAIDEDNVFSGSFIGKPSSHEIPNAIPSELKTFDDSRYAVIDDVVYYVDYRYDPGYGKYRDRGWVVNGAHASSFLAEDFFRVDGEVYDAQDDFWYYHLGKKKTKK